MRHLFENRCKTLTMEEAQKQLEMSKEIFVLDVRTRNEYESGHIPDSIHLPLHLLPVSLEQYVKDKQAKVFVYCRSGNRSQQACAFMMRQGYTDVTNIGGIISWQGSVIKGVS